MTTQTATATMDIRSFFGTSPKTSPETSPETSPVSSPKPPVSDAQKLVGLMTAYPPSTARELAKRSGGSMDKHLINQLLYANPELFRQAGMKGNAPLWSRIYA